MTTTLMKRSRWSSSPVDYFFFFASASSAFCFFLLFAFSQTFFKCFARVVLNEDNKTQTTNSFFFVWLLFLLDCLLFVLCFLFFFFSVLVSECVYNNSMHHRVFVICLKNIPCVWLGHYTRPWLNDRQANRLNNTSVISISSRLYIYISSALS